MHPFHSHPTPTEQRSLSQASAKYCLALSLCPMCRLSKPPNLFHNFPKFQNFQELGPISKLPAPDSKSHPDRGEGEGHTLSLILSPPAKKRESAREREGRRELERGEES